MATKKEVMEAFERQRLELWGPDLKLPGVARHVVTGGGTEADGFRVVANFRTWDEAWQYVKGYEFQRLQALRQMRRQKLSDD